MANFFLYEDTQFFDNNGNPLNGGQISTFQAGTTTPLATYTDSTGSTPNANPLVLDSSGRGQMWLSAAAYKFVIKNSVGATIATIDGYNPAAAAGSTNTTTGDFTMQQAVAATGGANQSSNTFRIQSNYWTGAASALDEWDISVVLGSGANPTSTLVFSHAGSPGTTAISFAVPLTFTNLNVSGNVNAGSAAITGNETVGGTLAVTGNTTLAGTLGVTGLSSLAATTMQSLNGLAIVMADQYANIQAAINALPATGGIVFAASPNVNKTMGAIDVGANNKPVTLILGPGTYTFTQMTVRQGFNIIGAGVLNTVLSNVGVNANPAFVIPQVNNNIITVHWSDFTVNALAGNTSQDGIFFDGSTLTNAGVQFSEFKNIIFSGFNGCGIHLKSTLNGISGSTGAIQFLNFINVTSHRPNGATGAGQNSLRIDGGCGQLEFWNCLFDAVTNDTGTNVFIGTTGVQGPYSIHFHGCTNQNGFAYLIDGATSITTDNDHFENIKGCYNLATTSQLLVGLNFRTPHVNSNVGVNAGNGYIVNAPNTVSNGDVTLDSPFIGSTPDNLVKNLASGCTVKVINARTFNSTSPANVYVSSGVTAAAIAPAATLDCHGFTSIQLSASGTSITTLKSTLMPGETITFYPTGGTAQFATGGNLSFGTQGSPLIIQAGDSATFMRVDAGSAAFILISNPAKPTITIKKGSGAGNYTSASTTYVPVDSTNLCFTVTIPVGWKLIVQAYLDVFVNTAAVAVNFAITDNAACGTANAGIVVESGQTPAAAGSGNSMALGTVINGDGNSHSVALQYKTSNAADSVGIVNGTATFIPTMIFTLTPSN